MKVILNDGSEHACDWAGASEGVLWIALTGTTLPAAVNVFDDPARTQRIEAVYSESNDMREIFEGYTELVNAHISENLVMIGLKRGDTT